MHADRLRSLRLRYLLALGVAAPVACVEGLPPGTIGGTGDAGSSSVSSEPTVARAPEFESKSIAPLPYGGNDCPVTMTRCMPGQADAGYDGPFPECSPEYTGEYYARSRLSLHETTKARRKDPNTCCYRVERPCNYDMPVIGRVLRDEDERAPRVAIPRRVDGWHGGLPGVRAEEFARLRPAPVALREAIALRWASDAASEHASVAAFSLVSLQLLALGAPAALVASTHEAARDEIEHARMSFAIASFHAGERVGPGALAVSSAASFAVSLETFAVDALVDGCVGETIAALVARESAARSDDDVVRAALGRIADDEERHAELAFRMVGWAVSRDAQLLAPLRRALDAVALSGAADGRDPLEPYGVLGEAARACVRDRALVHVVRPCLEALLAQL